MSNGQVTLYSTSGSKPESVYGFEIAAAGDLNLDGYGDYLVADGGAASTGDPPLVALSGPDGALLGSAITDPDIGFGSSLHGGVDIDLDGTPDFLAGAPLGTPAAGGSKPHPYGSAWLYSGSTFQPLRQHQQGPEPDGFGHVVRFLGDLDIDGIPDYAIQSSFFGLGKPELVTIISGFSGQVIRQHSALTNNTEFGTAIAQVGDTNFDGVPEYAIGATLDSIGVGTFEGSVSIFDGASGGLAHRHWGSAMEYYGSVLASVDDLDSDGVTDYASLGGVPAAVQCVSTATGVLISSTPSPPDHWLGASFEAADDMDGDGSRDLLVGCTALTAQATPALLATSTRTGDVLFRFERPADGSDLVFPWDTASIGDMDGDGRSEWLATSIFTVDSVTGGRGVVRVVSPRPLFADTSVVTNAAPQATFTVSAGVPHAGATYILVGSCSGFAGIPFYGETIPLTLDACTLLTLQLANSPVLKNSLGTLSPLGGQATVTFDVSLVPASAHGLKIWFAAAALGPGGAFASNAEQIVLDLLGS